MVEETYVEDSLITLPILSILNNLTKLGDLWDCHSSEIIGENLFDGTLDGDYVSASPIDALDYQLIHNKSSGDLIKSLKVGGELSLEFLAGLIPVKGSANYENEDNQTINREHVICNYTRETFSVFINHQAKSLINKMIENKILKGEIKATHFVRGIILGAQLNADIVISQNNKSNKTDFDGGICGKLVWGPINATAKANLSLLDKNENKDLSFNISVRSIPKFGYRDTFYRGNVQKN
jgi:hypothetical protein